MNKLALAVTFWFITFNVYTQDVFDIGVRQIEIFFSEPNWNDTLNAYYANGLGERLIADSILPPKTSASFTLQLLGVVSINAFVFVISFIIWFLMKNTFGIRLSKEGETKGTDVTETGVIAYAIRD